MKLIRIFLILLFISEITGCKKDPAENFKQAYNSYKEGTVSITAFHDQLVSFVRNNSFPKGVYLFEDTAVYTKNDNGLDIILPWKFNINLNEDTEDISVSASEPLKRMVLSHKKGIIVLNNRGGETGRYNVPEDSDQTVNGAAPFREGALFFMDNMLYIFNPSTGSVTPFRDSKFTPHYQKFFNVNFLETENILYIVYGSVGMYKISAINLSNDKTAIAGLNSASSRVFADNSQIYYIAGAIGNWELTKQPVSSSAGSRIRSFSDLHDIFLFKEGYAYQIYIKETKTYKTYISRYDGSPARIPFDNWKFLGKYSSNLIFSTGTEYVMADFSRFFEAFDIADGLLTD